MGYHYVDLGFLRFINKAKEKMPFFQLKNCDNFSSGESSRSAYANAYYLGLFTRKPVFGVSTKLDSNQPARLQRPARKLKFHL